MTKNTERIVAAEVLRAQGRYDEAALRYVQAALYAKDPKAGWELLTQAQEMKKAASEVNELEDWFAR